MGLHRFGSANPNWKGGRRKHGDGYIQVYVGRGHHLACSKGYAMQHRLIAEAHFGMILKDSDVVHHKDGNRSNNRPSNLKIMSESDHMKHHATGRRMSESAKRKISLARMGHDTSDQTRLKISITKKNDPMTSWNAKNNNRKNSVFTIVDIVNIRKRLAAGEKHRIIASEYGVGRTTITNIRLRKIWADI